MARNQKPVSTDANPIGDTPTAEVLADYVRYASVLAPHLSLEQRRQVILALGNPEPQAAPTKSPYESGKQYRFQIASGDVNGEVVAANDADAWALFCDQVKRWPGRPRPGNVTCLGEVAAVDSPIADLPPADSDSPIPGLPGSESTSEPITAGSDLDL